MKSLWIGLTCLLISSILYGSTMIAAAIYSQLLGSTDGLGWSTEYGIFGTAMLDIGIVPLVLAVIVGGTGVVLVVKDLQGHFVKKKEIDE